HGCLGQKSAYQDTHPVDSCAVIHRGFQLSVLDSGVPGIASSFWRRGGRPLAEPFQTVGDLQVSDEFYAFVAELARQPYPNRPAVAHGKLVAIHPISEKSLRMQCIRHVD